jgi:regulatory protein
VSRDGAQLERALGLAYRYLNRRERTEHELRGHLSAHDLDLATVEEAIDGLRAEGSLDDARYARLFTEDKRELEQWGNERIRRSLIERGIDRDLIESALAAGRPDSELDRALALLRQRFAAPPEAPRERERALGVLLRKGYDTEVALDAISSYERAPRESSLS